MMLRCLRSAGASVTCTVSRPLLERRAGSFSDGILKPAIAMVLIISMARMTPMPAKNPALRRLSDIGLCSRSKLYPSSLGGV